MINAFQLGMGRSFPGYLNWSYWERPAKFARYCDVFAKEYDFHLRIIGPYPADDKLMPLQSGGALEDQLPGRLLLVEGDEAEVLRGVVAQLVHGANHFYHRPKLVGRGSKSF